jgi:hypothetical protein
MFNDMNIHEFYYNDETRILYVEFSTIEDGDDYYRILKLVFEEVEKFSPDIITEVEMEEIDEDFVKDLIIQYLLENDAPEEMSL